MILEIRLLPTFILLIFLHASLGFCFEATIAAVNLHKEKFLNFTFDKTTPEGLEWDLNTKATVIFIGTILLIVIIVIAVYCIYKNRNTKPDIVVRARKVEEKVEKVFEDDLKKAKHKKIETIVKKVMVKEEIKENQSRVGDKTNDEGQDSSKSFVQKLREINLDDNKDNVTVKNLTKNVREVMNEYLVRLPRKASFESVNSHSRLQNILKKQMHKHVSNYDSEQRESPESSFFEENSPHSNRKKSDVTKKSGPTRGSKEVSDKKKAAEKSTSDNIELSPKKPILENPTEIKHDPVDISDRPLNPQRENFFANVKGDDDNNELKGMVIKDGEKKI